MNVSKTVVLPWERGLRCAFWNQTKIKHNFILTKTIITLFDRWLKKQPEWWDDPYLNK